MQNTGRAPVQPGQLPEVTGVQIGLRVPSRDLVGQPRQARHLPPVGVNAALQVEPQGAHAEPVELRDPLTPSHLRHPRRTDPGVPGEGLIRK